MTHFPKHKVPTLCGGVAYLPLVTSRHPHVISIWGVFPCYVFSNSLMSPLRVSFHEGETSGWQLWMSPWGRGRGRKRHQETGVPCHEGVHLHKITPVRRPKCGISTCYSATITQLPNMASDNFGGESASDVFLSFSNSCDRVQSRVYQHFCSCLGFVTYFQRFVSKHLGRVTHMCRCVWIRIQNSYNFSRGSCVYFRQTHPHLFTQIRFEPKMSK